MLCISIFEVVARRGVQVNRSPARSRTAIMHEDD